MAASRYRKGFLGELEQMILLAILQLEDGAYAPDVARLLEENAGRVVSRGALYTTLNRLEKKGFLRWDVRGISSDDDDRGGQPKRCFELTEAGKRALQVTRQALASLSEGLESTLAGGAR